MMFSSMQFIPFFLIVVLLALYFQKRNSPLNWLLIITSFIFYGLWDLRFIPLLFGYGLFNYFWGLKNLSKLSLLFGIIINLVPLILFKYTNFILDQMHTIFNLNINHYSIILPLGISFFTFEMISYLVDVYKGRLKAIVNIKDFLLFTAFFPRLVSGPIIRPKDFFEQIMNIKLSLDKLGFCIQLFLIGLIKKVLIADNLSLFVDKVYSNPFLFDSLTIISTILAYTIQIYMDFSGYSDMAIALALFFGIKIPQNFNAPYLATNIQEFWQRWHISLSLWLKDYLYIPLGGNKKGHFNQYKNILVTMLIGGLWHGASWNFVLWGGIHGIGICIHKLYMSFNKNKLVDLPKPFSWLLTFSFINITWILFRSPNFDTTIIIFKKLFTINSFGVHWIHTNFEIILFSVIIFHIIYMIKGSPIIFKQTNTFLFYFTLFFSILALYYMAPLKVTPFIYFQF